MKTHITYAHGRFLQSRKLCSDTAISKGGADVSFPLGLEHIDPKFIEDHKIQTRNFFGGNILLQPAYSHLAVGDPITLYPNATTNTFFLGTSPVISDEQIDYIETVVDKFVKEKNV